MPPFKVYKVMQDINQQLYERKDTPEGFIPVYGVVITVPTGIYTNGQKDFTCDKTFDEVKEIFKENMKTQRLFEEKVMKMSKKDFENNKDELSNCVEKIVKQMEA